MNNLQLTIYKVSKACLLVVAIGVITATVVLRAIERKPLPDFQVTALDGTSIKSADLVKQGKWLLIYVQAPCTSCDSMLKAVDATAHPDLPERVAIIVGGTDAPRAASIVSSYPDLAAATWYADPPAAARTALSLPGAPAVLGLKNGELVWSLLGVPDVESVRSAMASWCSSRLP